MGVSFKVSKNGTRFRPKPLLQSETNAVVDNVSEDSKNSSRIVGDEFNSRKLEGNTIDGVANLAGASGSSMSSERFRISTENEVSFTLNLFPDGYYIGKPSENETAPQSTLQDNPKSLHPYDRTSETLFSAIESGRLPGDILDDIPCKYVDGTLVCEVRDYRKCASERGPGATLTDGFPVVNKVHLRMSLENVVKDMPLISDNSWTYGDLMEVESRILKALQPQLCLDPAPKLDRLCNNPVPVKLDLALCSVRRKRLRQMPEVTVTANSKTHGKKICIERVPESSNCRMGDSVINSGNMMPQQVLENQTAHNSSPSNLLALRAKSFVSDASVPAPHSVSNQSRYQIGVRSMQDHGSGSIVNTSGASPAGQDMMMSYVDNINSNTSLHGKREAQDGPMSPIFNKRTRTTPMGLDGIQQQIGPQIDGFLGSEMNWKNTFLQQQAIARGIPYAHAGIQKYPQPVIEGVLNQDGGATAFAAGQQGMRYGAKDEQLETVKVDGSEFSGSKNDAPMVEAEISHLDTQQSRIQQRLPQHAFIRSNLPQSPWNTLTHHIEKDGRKEDQIQKRKSVQSPRLSAGTLVQSPLSSKSGEFSSGSVGPHFGTVTNATLGVSQKEKAAMSSVLAVGGTPSLTSSANDSMQRQHQAQLAAKRRSNSLPKTPAMTGVGSPASVGNIGIPLNANSPSVGTPPSAEQAMLDRFLKIDTVTGRHKLNDKKNKVDNPIEKPKSYSAQDLIRNLSYVSNSEDVKDEPCSLSKSLVGGSMNTCKSRFIVIVQPERVVQGSVVSYVPKIRTRMIMSEKPNDGTVAMHFGEIEYNQFLAMEDYLPTLPNTHLADLLAAQFCSLMEHDGYHVEDHVESKPSRMNLAPGNQSNTAGIPPNNSAAEIQQYAEAVSGQPSNEVAKPNISGNTSLNASQNPLASTRMLPPGSSSQALQMSQGLMSGASMPPRPQQLDSQPSLQQQQHQQQQQQQQQQQNQHSLIQQQHPQLQRSMMLGTTHLNAIGQNSNMQLGNHMMNKPSSLQLPMLQHQQQQHQQQQQQQQQQSQLQRKMMMGLGTAVGMGNVGNNIVGLTGLGNAMGMGTRGIAGTGISAPMTSISGMGNVGQNPMNLGQTSNISNTISQHIRSGSLSLMASRIRMAQAQNRASMLGGPQSGIGGISSARQMHPSPAGISMLGQTLNRANMNPMQRAAMGPMGPPKLMAGMNLYMNQQQQQQQQQQLQLQHPQLQQQQQLQQHQQLQQQLHQQQQQETTSPLQAVLSPQQVGSPSTMAIPQMTPQTQQQQQNSPQQISQRTPMSPQISSGAIHAMSAGNPEACPASPQLSSQTLGSVGSITNSPMDIQGVNKSNSVSNA